MKQMTNDTKSELLKYMILHHDYDYDLNLYSLITRNDLEKEISLIDEKTLLFDIDAQDTKISSKQFLSNLNEFVIWMKTYFFNSRHLSNCVRDIIDSNHQLLDELLRQECPKLHSFFNKEIDPNLEVIVIRLIISNFIYNAKYIDLVKDTLNDIDIQIKDVNDYTLEECRKILNLLSDIVFCQRGKGRLMSIFQNIDYEIDRSLEILSISNRKKDKSEEYRTKRIESFIEDYTKMIKAYQTKKKYIKYFN